MRGWNGNQDTGPVKKKKVFENKPTVNNEASISTIDASDKSVKVPSKSSSSVSPDPKPVQGNTVFDSDELLTGFRFVDTELLIDSVQSLLCPTCKRPLGQTSRQSHSRVTEHGTDQASKNLCLPASARKTLFC